MRLLDLFCGRWGVGRIFAKRGHEVVGIDLQEPPETPLGCRFIQCDVLKLKAKPGFVWIPERGWISVDFLWASSPCEEFSVHGMKHFHPNPPYPELGIKLFNHTRQLCEESGVPYVMENVRATQQFVGKATHRCGPFYLWGTGVPPLLPKGRELKKSFCSTATEYYKAKLQGPDQVNEMRKRYPHSYSGQGAARRESTAKIATIPPELANCVADYAERILEQQRR